MSRNFLFVILLMVTALVIASSAAYFSVFGMSKLFAGAGLSIIILFGALEIGKLVSVSVLYRYWKKFSNFIRTIFLLMILGIMVITSLGIYGFLTSAYQNTINKVEMSDNTISLIESRKNRFENQKTLINSEIDRKNKQIKDLQETSLALYNKTDSTVRWTYFNRAKEADKTIKEYDNEIKKLKDDLTVVEDSLFVYNQKITDLKSDNTVSKEIGPLRYLSDITGKPMDKVVNYLVLLIIFVFDPFAITLIITANRLTMKDDKDKEDDKIEPGKFLTKFIKKDDGGGGDVVTEQEVKQATISVDDNGNLIVLDKEGKIVDLDRSNASTDLELIKQELSDIMAVINKENDDYLDSIKKMKKDVMDLKDDVDEKTQKLKLSKKEIKEDLEEGIKDNLEHVEEKMSDKIDDLRKMIEAIKKRNGLL